jgi:excinuclease ABC subunit A
MADYIIDIGPDGGKKGGKIVAAGTPEEIIKSKDSLTAKYLAQELK